MKLSEIRAGHTIFALVLGLGLICFAALAYIYLGSERYLADVTPGERFLLTAQQDQATIEHGRHVARTRGCFGCHGQQLDGAVFSDEWDWVKLAVAPNLARFAREHDAATIEAAVRQGIGHDGRALWSMPSYNWANLSDKDMGALVVFLRSAPEMASGDLPKPSYGWTARWLMARGDAQHMAEWAKKMSPLLLGEGDDPQLGRGEYIAKTTCNECHGFDLRGLWDSPDLAILTAYSEADFRTLMKTGVALGGRTDLTLMSMVAKDRFAYFTESELTDVLAYLRTLPDQPIEADAAWRDLR